MRDAVLSVQRLQRNVTCSVETTTASSSSSFNESTSFDDTLQRADKTRFISAASVAVDPQFTAAWLHAMAAHRFAQSVTGQTGQRGSKWGRSQWIPGIDVDALFSPEPETARSSSLSSAEDVFQLLASYCEALRLAFIVVDVLLVSYHVTRTCVSAHALWTVGFRERETLRLADIASLSCDMRQLRASGVPAVVVPTELPNEANAGSDDRTQQQQHLTAAESLPDGSVANHRDVVLPSSLPNHSATGLYQCRHSQSTSTADEKKSRKVKYRFVSTSAFELNNA